ncbi:MAG: 4-hydroxybenzoate octaprenyltransferase [Gammaproteobacteria bacterium]
MKQINKHLDRIVRFCRDYGGLAVAHCRRWWHRAQVWYVNHWPDIRRRLVLYARLARMDKPIGALLLLWPTLWALWIAAEGLPSLHLFLVFTIGTFLARSAGCAVNDFADREIDPHVARTVGRPLATGEVRPREAITVAGALLLLAFLLVLTTDRFTVLLSLGAIPLLAVYPYMKRHTYIPQFFLGLAFSWGIPMAFAAQAGELTSITWLLYVANVLWVVIFDTIYAMVDREYDIRIGVKSTAILFADADRAIIGIMQAMLLAALVILGRQLQLDWIYYLFLLLVAGIMLYHQYLIRNRVPEECFRAFLNNNWLGAAVFAGLFFSY